MIAVDTSAMLAIALDESHADACMAALEIEEDLLISAGTLSEALRRMHRRQGDALAGRLAATLERERAAILVKLDR